MIQPNFPVHQANAYTTLVGATVVNTDEDAFRTWLLRRDAARQQMRRLSRRELQVVVLVSQGLANKSIAQQLEISVKTIEKHRANAARKLGVNSTADLVRITILADQEPLTVTNRVRSEIAPRPVTEVHSFEN